MLLLLSGSSAAFATDAPSAVRVLFVGNSHTATHDLPRTVAVLAKQHGIAMEVESLAEPGHSLADHLSQGRLQEALARPWDWVILQQGPSALPASRIDLLRSTERIAAELQGRPVRIALMSVWPARSNRASSPAAESSYRQAAVAIDACVLPVATAWRHVLDGDEPPRLYQHDRLHATASGSVLAALTIAHAFTGDAAGPPSVDAPAYTPGTAELRVLEAAAYRAYREEPRRCAP